MPRLREPMRPLFRAGRGKGGSPGRLTSKRMVRNETRGRYFAPSSRRKSALCRLSSRRRVVALAWTDDSAAGQADHTDHLNFWHGVHVPPAWILDTRGERSDARTVLTHPTSNSDEHWSRSSAAGAQRSLASHTKWSTTTKLRPSGHRSSFGSPMMTCCASYGCDADRAHVRIARPERLSKRTTGERLDTASSRTNARPK